MNTRLRYLATEAHLPACHTTHPIALARFAKLIREDVVDDCVFFIRQMVKNGYLTGEALNQLEKSKGERPPWYKYATDQEVLNEVKIRNLNVEVPK